MTKLTLLIHISASEIFEEKKWEKKSEHFYRIVSSIGWKGVKRYFSIHACHHQHHHVWCAQCVLQICDPFSIWFAIQSRFDQCENCVCVCEWVFELELEPEPMYVWSLYDFYSIFRFTHNSVIVPNLKCIIHSRNGKEFNLPPLIRFNLLWIILIIEQIIVDCRAGACKSVEQNKYECMIFYFFLLFYLFTSITSH